ncbi:MAG: hypothetical protein M1823_002470 [Watsoniomyces obsoletus]|nr:MAG: hypothetical protein M1823_002470 [Watsoniomyces obsoletus]
MALQSRNAVYCAACAGPLDYRDEDGFILYQLDEEGWNDEGDQVPTPGPITEDEMEVKKWLADLRLLGRRPKWRHPQDESDDGELDEFDYGYNDHPLFLEGEFFMIPAEWLGTNGLSLEDEQLPPVILAYDHSNTDSYAYLPIHTRCISIAARVLERRLRNGGGRNPDAPLRFEELYDRLNSQSLAAQKQRGGEMIDCCVRWPHRSYGAERLQGNFWDCEIDMEWFCFDPVGIPSLTEEVLANLQRRASTEDPSKKSIPADRTPTGPKSHLESLPNELLQSVASFLPISSLLALDRTSRGLHGRVLSQTIWREALIGGDLVGYLWDLDASACRIIKGPAEDWDWYGLARELARRDVFESGSGLVGGIPSGLRNRQRIWRILVDV